MAISSPDITPGSQEALVTLLPALTEQSGLDWPGSVRVARLPGYDGADEPDRQGELW
ncbi:hypothetical protein L3Q67_26300 [Saccharothrix sp. AJ9571]|nr:hypothetical protein L3Q67_26300 [Saccharothrix sp. AJ9571]